MLVTILVFIIVLGLLVFVHELGHFMMAKKAGVRVDEFAFGFRPKIWSKKIGETTYAINAIPLGGYVRLFGEQEGESGPRSFKQKSIRTRLGIFVAGSVMNLILGWLILTVLFIIGFNPLFSGVGNNPFVDIEQSVIIAKVNAGSPAQSAGLIEGQKIIAVETEKVISDTQFVSLINERKGKAVKVTVEDQGNLRILEVTPRVSPPVGEGSLGVTIGLSGQAKTPFYKAPVASIYEVGRVAWGSVVGFGGFISKLVVHQQIAEDVTGIVGVGQLTAIYRRAGIDYLAQLVALISIGLAVINLVPILPLDGGHVAALAYEKATRRPMSEKQFNSFATVGIVIVLILFVTVTYKDLVRFNVFERVINAF